MNAARWATAWLLTAAVLAACVSPFGKVPAPDAAIAAANASATDTAPPPIVQVRTYRGAPHVDILAWNPGENAFGLRASVALTGELVGAARRGEHTLYVTPEYAREMGGFGAARTTPASQPLLVVGWRRDDYACFYGKQCAPVFAMGFSLPDSILRAHRDSLVVEFSPALTDRWSITLDHNLITAYLKTVDSVVAATRRVAANSR